MIDGLIDFLSGAAERRLRDCLLGSILAVLGALFAAVSLGFATFAGYASLRASEGAVAAALIVCAAYGLFALSIWTIALLRRSSRRRPARAPAAPAPASPGSLEALLQSLNAGGAPQDQAALAVAMQLGRELSTMQLLAVALVGGFLAGRRLGK